MYRILNSRKWLKHIHDQIFINIFIYNKYSMTIIYYIVSDIDNY